MNRYRQHFPKQTLFAPQIGTQATGNCYQVCVACILDLPVEEVPHFYGETDDIDLANANIVKYLAAQGCYQIYMDWGYFMGLYQKQLIRLPEGNLVILGGKSPRGDFEHAVLGTVNPDGTYTIVHDPHPTDAGLVGEPTAIEMITYVPVVNV